MNIRNGLIAGFVATVAISVLFVLKAMMGLMPQMDIIAMLAGAMGGSVVMAWLAHFIIGTVLWGGLFALANNAIPGASQLARGTVFGLAAWLVMAIVVLPMMGAGLFGLNMGMMAAVMPLVIHLIFGAVMGATYGALDHTAPSEA